MFLTPTPNNCLLALSCFGKIGPSDTKYLERFFHPLSLAFRAEKGALIRSGLHPKIADDFINWRKTWDERRILYELADNNITYISWHSPDYPNLLKEIPSPPPIIYLSGQIKNPAPNSLSVVGSRNPSLYGKALIKHLLTKVVDRKINIISGLARGIDTLAHKLAIDNNGVTWAVLGSGLLNIYPKENQTLAKRIVNGGGTVISEFPLHSPPCKNNFPRRNRLISGLAPATLIIEAGERSGSLITARHALEQGRDVLAVPGNIFSPNSAGTNSLIASGAGVVTSAEDILAIYQQQ